MENFAYHRPAQVSEAVKLMQQASDGKFLAGGMTLLPTMKLGLATPSDVIDLAGLGNSGVSVAGDMVIIKAGTTHQQVATDTALKSAIPGLVQLAKGIGDPHVRNRGTIGGSIANADPAADYPAAIVGLN